MDEIEVFRDWVKTASRRPLELGDMREAVRNGIAEAKGAFPLSGAAVFPLFRDVYFRVASAAMITVVAGLGVGYYGLVGIASEWSYHSVLGGLSALWGVF